MATQLSHIELARTLPPKLLRFFARYPPANLASSSPSLTTPASSASETESSGQEASPATSSPAALDQDPFQVSKHPVTGAWRNPIYSLRRQADLVKLARTHGVEELLPTTIKGTQERIDRRKEHGLRVKGTGVDQKVKGHWRERTLKGRLEKRRQAMLEMPQMIQKWKQVSRLHAGTTTAQSHRTLARARKRMEEVSQMIGACLTIACVYIARVHSSLRERVKIA